MEDVYYMPPSDVTEDRLEWLKGFRGRKQRLETLVHGYATPTGEMLCLFEDTVNWNSNYMLVFREILGDGAKGDLIGVSSKSRWNLKRPNYKKMVEQRLKDNVKGLNNATLLTLTYDPKKVFEANPYFQIDDRVWLVSEAWSHLKAFLGRLERYRKRKGVKWSYVGAVVEFQKSGYLHFHLIFAGRYIAPIDVLTRYWPYSEPQGVDVRNHDTLNTVAYLVKYLGKSKKAKVGDTYHIGYASAYYFGTRIYNIRHSQAPLYGEKKEYELLGACFAPDGEFTGHVDVRFNQDGEGGLEDYEETG